MAFGFGLPWKRSLGAKGSNKPPSRPGSISGYGLNWTDGKGTQYSVHGFTSRKQTLGKDVLIAIAKSIDPTLDVSKLDEQPEVPRPYTK